MTTLFDTSSDWPPWFTAGKTTPTTHIRNVANRRHPLGLGLIDRDDATCGNCKHLRVKRLGNTYIKCGIGPNTGGSATDIRRKWRGCSAWEEK